MSNDEKGVLPPTLTRRLQETSTEHDKDFDNDDDKKDPKQQQQPPPLPSSADEQLTEAITHKRKRKRKRKKASGDHENTTTTSTIVASSSSSLELTAYVEGIPFDATTEQVKDFFVTKGCPDVMELRLPTWQDSGRLRGYGHVVFGSTASRNKAIADLNGQYMSTTTTTNGGGTTTTTTTSSSKSRYLSIQPPHAPRNDTTQGAALPRTTRAQPHDCCVVFVKNLPYDATEDDIATVFTMCGKLQSPGGVRIARNSQTQQSKGFAYVQFRRPEGAYSAVQKAAKPFGMTVRGRPCFVDYDEGTMKGSYKTKEGRLWTREYGKQQRTGARGTS